VEAFVLDASMAVVDQVEPSLETLKQQFVAADLVRFYEGGLPVEGRLNWLHIVSFILYPSGRVA